MARCVSLACLLCLTVATPVPAQAPRSRITLPGENAGTGRRLQAADQLAADGHWAEALDEYQHVLDEAGADLVPLDAGHSIEARRLCHLRLAGLPAEPLRLYRERVDDQAKKWLAQAEKARDTRLLRRIVDDAFCSGVTDRALDLLGDLAFERGDFEEAERWWRMLALPASEMNRQTPKKKARSLDLLYPDPRVDLARVRAKQLLAHLFRGEREGFEKDLKAYRALHGKASGDFAGHTGNYADTLSLLARRGETLLAPTAEDAWTTFAGAPSRTLVLPRAPGRLPWTLTVGDSPWPKPLGREAGRPAPRRTPRDASPEEARFLAFYPVVVGDQALVADARSVTAYDLLTGAATVWYQLARDDHVRNSPQPQPLGAEADPRYTLTVAGDRMYLRLGAQGLGPLSEDEQEHRRGDSYLVCLNRQPDHNGNRRRWLQRANKADVKGRVDMFEGAPVVHDGCAYIAVTRFAGAVATTSVACYDADTGAPRWRNPVEVCQTRGRRAGPRYHHHLLTLAGADLVYCSHCGAVIALDAASGRRAWAMRYPSRGDKLDEGAASPRDLCPCVYADGRVFAAPADLDHILCLDADTGRTMWESDPMEVVHLLGVAGGRLIFTTAASTSLDPPRSTTAGLRAVDVFTGETLRQWTKPDTESNLYAFGRGFLAGGLVFWPTTEGLRVLKLEDGEQASEWSGFAGHKEPMGNLAFGHGCLVVANATQLWAYVPESLYLDQWRKRAAADPEAALPRYRLALAEADAGFDGDALADLARVERLAKPDERCCGVPLRGLARTRRHELLLDEAERARGRGRWDEAVASLERAAAEEFAVPRRLQALAREASLLTEAARPARAVAVWQRILRDDALRDGPVAIADDIPQAGGTLAADRIDQLIRAHGPAIYDPFEQQARSLQASAESGNRIGVLERLARQYPNAAVTRPALLQLSALQEKAGRPGAAAQAYRLLLARSGEPAEEAAALAGLARAYEVQHCWQAARATWQRLARAYGERTLAVLDPAHPVRAVVSRQLQKLEYQPVPAPNGTTAADPPPRTWSTALTPREQLLAADEERTGGGCHPVFFARDRVLSCRDAATGKLRWTRSLPQAPCWVGRHADMVLAAGPDGIYSLSLADGTTLWQFMAQPAAAYGRQTLTAFHLSPSRLFFFQGERRLFALDADTGRVLWARWAPGAQVAPGFPAGRFYPRYHAGENWVVVQTTAGKLLVFDSHTGRQVHDGQTSREPWPRPPRALDERHICLVPDAHHIVLFDAAAGRPVWTRRTRTPSISAQAAQVLGDSKALLGLIDGWQLERLDPLTGRRRWQCAIGNEPVDVARTALDQTAVYFVSRNVLHARALDDGRSLWQLPLGGTVGPWRVVRSHHALIALPLQAEQEFDRPWTAGGYLMAFPWELAWRDLPVLLCDPGRGQVVRRLQLPAQGPRVAVQVLEQATVIGLAGHAWALLAGGRD